MVDGMIQIDAFTGQTEPVAGGFANNRLAWALDMPRYGEPTMRPPSQNDADWSDKAVGWGLILPEPKGYSVEHLIRAEDAPEPIRQLVATRRGKVLRYRPGATLRDWILRDYAGGGDRLSAASAVGTGPNEVPKYLLIYGTPTEVPWHVQFALNPVRFVGRLDLTGQALENYVRALLESWSGSASSYASPVVWAVDHGAGDITALMRDTFAEPIYQALATDSEMSSARFIDGRVQAATLATLYQALTSNRPSLIVTSSHGMTGPLSDLDAMRANLGLPVDQDRNVLSTAALLKNWQPDGAIWYSQACCSAGSDSPTNYAGLFEAGSRLDNTLTGIAQVGAGVAPLPRALLGAPKPLRAFIGHVEPTFNWTLSFPNNAQALTGDLKSALYGRLSGGQPVGMAMSVYYPPIAALLQQYIRARQEYEVSDGPDAESAVRMLVYSRVTAHDRASTVILGDPTAAIPLATG